MTEWTVTHDPAEADLGAVSNGVLQYGRALAADGLALPIACLLRHDDALIAGATGRTEYQRLFVHYLWVSPLFRKRGFGIETLRKLEDAACRDGCRDALVETLDDGLAGLYARLGYVELARVRNYVGPFHRHILLKSLGAPELAEKRTS